ncbi:MAG: FliA/WhiG family RNA polymerase sigma factor [Longimicrobiales bacterium]
MSAKQRVDERPELPEGFDEQANPMVVQNLGLVYDLAAKLQRSAGIGPERDDLVSAGVRGLIQAAENFDASRGLSFSTLAVARIRGAMLDELRGWDRVPRSVRQKERKVRAGEAALRARLHRQPTTEEVAAELSMSVEDLHGWYVDLAHHMDESLDESPTTHLYDSPRSTGRQVADGGQDVVDRLGREQAIGILERCIGDLPEREARVLALYYFEELRLREIAQILGVTESRVSQVRHSALAKLRSLLIQKGVEP